ncbi:MAG: GntR family transcriptional regulator, partial [Armatimonadota bacterium]
DASRSGLGIMEGLTSGAILYIILDIGTRRRGGATMIADGDQHDGTGEGAVTARRSIPPTISESIADALREQILAGELPPGTHLKEEEVAQQFDVSVAPVREALRQIAADGLVDVRARRGAFVAELDVDDFRELTEMREGLELIAFGRLATRITDQDMARLTEHHEGYRDGVLEGRYRDAVRADLAFHDYVADRSGNSRLAEAIQRISTLRFHFNLWRVASSGASDDVERHGSSQVAVSHLPLLEALDSGDPERAEKAVREHIRRAFEATLDVIRQRESMHRHKNEE